MTDEIAKTDFYIKLESEGDLPIAMAAFYQGDELVQYTHEYAMHIVGDIWKPSGKMLKDNAGFEYPEMTKIDGYHINIRLVGEGKRADVEALGDLIVNPDPVTPSCVWA